jgi:TonB family protein
LVRGERVNVAGEVIRHGQLTGIPDAWYFTLKDEQYGLVECRGSWLQLSRLANAKNWVASQPHDNRTPLPSFVKAHGDLFRTRPGVGIVLQPCEFDDLSATASRDPLPPSIDPTNHGPKATYSVDPDYSEQARKARLEGVCVLAVTVTVDGLPKDISVVNSLGMGLDEQAEAALAKWRFAAAMRDGQPVEQRVKIGFTFKVY